MLRELRFVFTPAHTHVIAYLNKEVKTLSKKTCVLIREAATGPAEVIGRFEKGDEVRYPVGENVQAAVDKILLNK